MDVDFDIFLREREVKMQVEDRDEEEGDEPEGEKWRENLGLDARRLGHQ